MMLTLETCFHQAFPTFHSRSKFQDDLGTLVLFHRLAASYCMTRKQVKQVTYECLGAVDIRHNHTLQSLHYRQFMQSSTPVYLSRIFLPFFNHEIMPRHLGPTVSRISVPNITGVAMPQKNSSFWSLTEGIVSKFMPK